MVLALVVLPAVRWLMIYIPEMAAILDSESASKNSLQLSFDYYQAGYYEEAIKAAKSAITVNPNSADAYNNLAISYMKLRRVDDAIMAAKEAIRLRPDFQLAKNNLAWFQGEKAKPTRSQNLMSQVDALLNQSLQNARSNRFEECMKTAMEAAILDPNSSHAFNNIGFCAARLHLWEEAIRNTQEAIRLDPGFQLARNNLVWMQQEKVKIGKRTDERN